MFERFTAQARQAVTHADEVARELEHEYIEVGDLLLALYEFPSIAQSVLESERGDRDEVEQMVKRLPTRTLARNANEQVPFADDTKKVLELSLREALSLGHNYIGPEHILLGIVRMGTVLLDAERIRNEVIRTLSSLPPPSHKVGWTPAMLQACATYQDVAGELAALLGRQSMSLLGLRALADDVAVAAEALRDAVDHAVLPQPGQP